MWYGWIAEPSVIGAPGVRALPKTWTSFGDFQMARSIGYQQLAALEFTSGK